MQKIYKRTDPRYIRRNNRRRHLEALTGMVKDVAPDFMALLSIAGAFAVISLFIALIA